MVFAGMRARPVAWQADKVEEKLGGSDRF